MSNSSGSWKVQLHGWSNEKFRPALEGMLKFQHAKGIKGRSRELRRNPSWTWCQGFIGFLVKFRIPGVATNFSVTLHLSYGLQSDSQWCDQVGSRKFVCITFRDLREFDVFCGSLTLFCRSFAGNSSRFLTSKTKNKTTCHAETL